MTYEDNYLAHHGVKGQQWGVRRYQNEDGTLTEEGKRRYLDMTDESISVYNKTADITNQKSLKSINKKYQNIEANDENNLAYYKELREEWQKNYRNVLAKSLKTDPSTLTGQKWLGDLFGYKAFDKEVENYEKKVANQKRLMKENSHKKYANTKMTSDQAMNQAYKDITKKYPDYNKYSQDKQDKLFNDYLNSSGLNLWV